ncbi:MAG: CBS domain-containing protein [Bdellovibrionales bacterium]
MGIISDRDLELLKTSKNVEELKIKDVMNFEPFIVGPSTPIAKVAADMIEKGVGSAIVRAENSTPWGIFTITDALKVIRDHVH